RPLPRHRHRAAANRIDVQRDRRADDHVRLRVLPVAWARCGAGDEVRGAGESARVCGGGDAGGADAGGAAYERVRDRGGAARDDGVLPVGGTAVVREARGVVSAPAIVCDSLTRDFGGVRALDALSLEVPAGAVFAFLGANGAGKTTTIHLLLGLLEPTAGASRVLGFDPARDGADVRQRCGSLLEHAGLYERLSAIDNLAF